MYDPTGESIDKQSWTKLGTAHHFRVSIERACCRWPMYVCRELYDGKNADEMCWVQQLLGSKKKKKKTGNLFAAATGTYRDRVR